jgi:hypothetical protein
MDQLERGESEQASTNERRPPPLRRLGVLVERGVRWAGTARLERRLVDGKSGARHAEGVADEPERATYFPGSSEENSWRPNY